MGGREPFSDKDLLKVISTFNNTGGKVNQIVATAREGTYKAFVTKKATKQQVAQAINRAENNIKGKKFQSEYAMWMAMHDAYANSFAKIGVKITFTRQTKAQRKFVSQKIGVEL